LGKKIHASISGEPSTESEKRRPGRKREARGFLQKASHVSSEQSVPFEKEKASKDTKPKDHADAHWKKRTSLPRYPSKDNKKRP